MCIVTQWVTDSAITAWLSVGKTLVRVITLRSEVVVLSVGRPFRHSSRLCAIQRLAYLADIFTKRNFLNLSF
jgi:hypothetical protein